MPESFLLALLEAAERWASRAGSTLELRAQWTPAVFAAGRRNEERALMAAAAEVYDLVGATPDGRVLMADMGLNPDAGELPSPEGLQARLDEFKARAATKS